MANMEAVMSPPPAAESAAAESAAAESAVAPAAAPAKKKQRHNSVGDHNILLLDTNTYKLFNAPPSGLDNIEEVLQRSSGGEEPLSQQRLSKAIRTLQKQAKNDETFKRLEPLMGHTASYEGRPCIVLGLEQEACLKDDGTWDPFQVRDASKMMVSAVQQLDIAMNAEKLRLQQLAGWSEDPQIDEECLAAAVAFRLHYAASTRRGFAVGGGAPLLADRLQALHHRLVDAVRYVSVGLRPTKADEDAIRKER
ncbi:unnamed protein product, partial [Symbiodinium sp. CCMP2456]